MINKKQVLGRDPETAGKKDAVHVAIVGACAKEYLKPGERVSLDENNLASSDEKGFGVVDPFRKRPVMRGGFFWLCLGPEEVENVEHTWEYPKDFEPKVSPDTVSPNTVSQNEYLAECAKEMGVSYEQLMQACRTYADTDVQVCYPGTLSEETVREKVENYIIDHYEMWSCWEDENGGDIFPDYGTGCCPEIEYPDDIPFKWC